MIIWKLTIARRTYTSNLPRRAEDGPDLAIVLFEKPVGLIGADVTQCHNQSGLDHAVGTNKQFRGLGPIEVGL